MGMIIAFAVLGVIVQLVHEDDWHGSCFRRGGGDQLVCCRVLYLVGGVKW